MSDNGKGDLRRPLVLVSKEEFDSNWEATFARCSECGCRDNLIKLKGKDHFGHEIDVIVCESCHNNQEV